jgi:hypothetical protein
MDSIQVLIELCDVMVFDVGIVIYLDNNLLFPRNAKCLYNFTILSSFKWQYLPYNTFSKIA